MPDTLAIPQGACDAHLHVYDAAAPSRTAIPPGAEVADYARLRSRLGFARAVLVQPRPYGTDNTVLLASIAALGSADTRGVAVLHPDVSERELQALHAGGVRGIRLSLHSPANAAVSFEMLEPLAHRVHPLGWHLQLHWTAQQIVEREDRLRRLPTPLVFDHMVRLPAAEGARHPAFDVVLRLLREQRAWVKLSGPYLESRTGFADGFRDVDAIAQAWIDKAPERLVWGSDWPQNDWHGPTRSEAPGTLLAALRRWAGSAAMMRRLLVDNPATLYGFGRA